MLSLNLNQCQIRFLHPLPIILRPSGSYHSASIRFHQRLLSMIILSTNHNRASITPEPKPVHQRLPIVHVSPRVPKITESRKNKMRTYLVWTIGWNGSNTMNYWFPAAHQIGLGAKRRHLLNSLDIGILLKHFIEHAWAANASLLAYL